MPRRVGDIFPTLLPRQSRGRKVLPYKSSSTELRGETMGEPSSSSLREAIRGRLIDGSLPVITGAAWAGTASGDHRCACCHRTIRAADIEYEPRDQISTYAHIDCFTLWLSESRLVGASPRSRSESAA